MSTSNFGSNDGIYGYSFPLVVFRSERYYLDDDGNETENRDYDEESEDYEKAARHAEDLADEMGLALYKDVYDGGYGTPFLLEIEPGKYDGMWVRIREGDCTGKEKEYDEDSGEWEYADLTDEEMDAEAEKVNEYLDRLCKEQGWEKLGVTARFSNSETWYYKREKDRRGFSRNPWNSRIYEGRKRPDGVEPILITESDLRRYGIRLIRENEDYEEFIGEKPESPEAEDALRKRIMRSARSDRYTYFPENSLKWDDERNCYVIQGEDDYSGSRYLYKVLVPRDRRKACRFKIIDCLEYCEV